MDSTQIYEWFSVNDGNHKGVDYRVHMALSSVGFTRLHMKGFAIQPCFCMSSNLSFVCVSCHNAPFFIYVQG
jgi:hypothetical protein